MLLACLIQAIFGLFKVVICDDAERHEFNRTDDKKGAIPILKALQRIRMMANAGANACPISGNIETLKESLLQFLQKSPSPYHAVHEASKLLMAGGFEPLDEALPWCYEAQQGHDWENLPNSTCLKPGGKYFVRRNGSSLIAFTLGGDFSLTKRPRAVPPFRIIAAHTDSPCLKVRPSPKKMKDGYEMLAVSTYGGGLWHTWFDRDLGVAGKVVLHDEVSGTMRDVLVNIAKPILRIPNLAIHLDRSIHEGFKFNAETQLLPMLVNATPNQGKALGTESALMALLREHIEDLCVDSEVILEHDLSLYDVQAPVYAGPAQEFLCSARLDNLLMSYTALAALLASCSTLEHDSGVNVVALFDHEEVGSTSAIGADSSFLVDLLGRIARVNQQTPSTWLDVALKRSFIISADTAHALHPNYADKYEAGHAPLMNAGLVIKYNPNQRYMTSAVSAALFKALIKNHILRDSTKECQKVSQEDEACIASQSNTGKGCQKDEAKASDASSKDTINKNASSSNGYYQEFMVKNDSSCGSTIGPFLASKTGIPTIDVGIPILAMHSIREMAGILDVPKTIHIFHTFFTRFGLPNTPTK